MMVKNTEKQAEELGIKIEKRRIEREEDDYEYEAEIFDFTYKGENYKIEISHYEWYTDMLIRFKKETYKREAFVWMLTYMMNYAYEKELWALRLPKDLIKMLHFIKKDEIPEGKVFPEQFDVKKLEEFITLYEDNHIDCEQEVNTLKRLFVFDRNKKQVSDYMNFQIELDGIMNENIKNDPTVSFDFQGLIFKKLEVDVPYYLWGEHGRMEITFNEGNYRIMEGGEELIHSSSYQEVIQFFENVIKQTKIRRRLENVYDHPMEHTKRLLINKGIHNMTLIEQIVMQMKKFKTCDEMEYEVASKKANFEYIFSEVYRFSTEYTEYRVTVFKLFEKFVFYGGEKKDKEETMYSIVGDKEKVMPAVEHYISSILANKMISHIKGRMDEGEE